MDGMEREKVWHVRIAVAAALVGCAGVVSGLRHELGLGWAVGLLTACLLGVALALRDVHHRVDQEEVTSPDDMPETSYATRAKLVMPTPADDEKWTLVNDRIRVMPNREHLLVSNTGPKHRVQ